MIKVIMVKKHSLTQPKYIEVTTPASCSYCEILKDDLKIGDTKEFSMFVDNREPPELDSGLFHIEDTHFEEDGDWADLVKDLVEKCFLHL